MVIIATKFEVDMTIPCQVIAFCCRYIMLPCDQHIRGFGKDALYKSTFCITLNYITLIFDLEQLSYMAGHVINPAIKFENTMPICS